MRRHILTGTCTLTQCVGDEGLYVENGMVGTHVNDLLAIGLKKELDQVKTTLQKQLELDKQTIENAWN